MKIKREYTDEQLINRVWDIEEVKDLMSRRFYLHTNEQRARELDELWVSSEEFKKTASFGRNWGYYVGMDAIRKYYVEDYDRMRRAHLRALCDADPTIEFKPENLSYGCVSNHPVSTALVELAGDGKTARGLWYSIAQETTSVPGGGAEALWMPEKIAADFVCEDGKWKIWHLVIATDFVTGAGEDYSQQPPYPEPGTNPVELEFGEPTIKRLVHDSTFNWWDNYPPMPEPYDTFSDETSYGPEGYHPPIGKEVR